MALIALCLMLSNARGINNKDLMMREDISRLEEDDRTLIYLAATAGWFVMLWYKEKYLMMRRDKREE